MMTRLRSVSRASSASTDSEYTGTTESVHASDSYSDYLTRTASFLPQPISSTNTKGRESTSTSTKPKREPFDENHHSLALRVPTPPPEAVFSVPVNKKSNLTATNRRTSTRARSARLATSPIMSSGRLLSSTGSPASNENDGQPKRLTRSRMSASQRAYLHGIYGQNPEPTMAERQVIADKLGVQIGKITNWFRNLRQSVRRGRLLDAKQASTRGTTVESKGEEDEEDEADNREVEREMDVDEGGSQSEEDARVSPSPAPPATATTAAAPSASIVPGKGAYSTQTLIGAAYAALHSPSDSYADDDEEEEEEEHEALTPHPSPESKMAHSFGPNSSALNVNSNTHENILASPSPSSRGLPSISITLAQSESDQKRRHQQDQKYHSAIEDALLLLHFRQNCDVRDIHHGVVVERPSSPALY
jgi:hypothetical protein